MKKIIVIIIILLILLGGLGAVYLYFNWNNFFFDSGERYDSTKLDFMVISTDKYR